MSADHNPVAELLEQKLACPVCKHGLPALSAATRELPCGSCGALYRRATYSFDFTPPAAFRDGSPVWQAWDQVQANGFTGYTVDPDRNLSVGHRHDCDLFRAFCQCRGLALDVGCGPQEWPAYFDKSAAVAYVGVDPFADDRPAGFVRFIGLAEFLPFAAGSFDHVLFSTTLDHFVDPGRALAEAARVLKPGGEVDVWLGEKDAAAPKPAVSSPWYERLERPELADDVFHIKRMSATDFEALGSTAGLAVLEHEQHPLDRYRVNHYYRLRPAR